MLHIMKSGPKYVVFSLFTMVMVSFLLFTPTAAQARVSLTDLQNQIHALQAQVDALQAQVDAQAGGVGAGPAAAPDENFVPGVIATAAIEDCLHNEEGIDCEQKQSLLIGVPEGGLAAVEVMTVDTIKGPNGEPIPLEEIVEIEMRQIPRPGGTGYDIQGRMEKGEYQMTFDLSLDAPVFTSKNTDDYNNFKFKAAMVTGTQVRLIMDVDEIKDVDTESAGIIISAAVDPYAQGSTTARLTVRIQNQGDLATDYIVTATEFSGNVVDPAPAQMRYLLPNLNHEEVVAFDLHAEDGFYTGMECKVTLLSPTGRIYDSVTIIFP